MEKFNIILKLGINFFKRYWIDYLALMIIPVLLMIASMFIFGFCVFLTLTLPYKLADMNIIAETSGLHWGVAGIFLIVNLIGIALFAYAFWRICFITYSINHAVFNFAKQNELKPLNFYLNEIKRDEKGLILFLLKSSLIAFLPFAPVFLFGCYALCNREAAMDLISNLPFNPFYFMIYAILFLIWVILLYPYLNLMFQAYYYRENEDTFSIFKDCYKYLDSTFFLILLFAILAQIMFHSISGSILGSIIGIFLSLFVCILYSFWFYIKKFKTIESNQNNIEKIDN